jgi:(p)ppGpp synthase/HD superfamily hydrolase
MFSYRVEQAIRAATILHDGQIRKGSLAIPYISHLFSVAILLKDYTNDEDTLIAAILHDTIEDTDYTLKELSNDFGERVASLVLTLTEPPRHTVSSWLEQKKIYSQQIDSGPIEAVLIAAIDKMHNFRSMIDEYRSKQHTFKKDFGNKIEIRIEAYQHISNVINRRLSGPIISEYNASFFEYKEFLYEIKQNQENAAL